LTESDRAAGVLGRAYADAMLEKLLHEYLVRGDATKELLRQSGPAGSFSARIQLASAVGLISDPTRDDLDVVREIGNHFAHSVTASFDKSPVSDFCQNFWASREAKKKGRPDESPRGQFNTGLVYIAMELEYISEEKRRCTTPQPRSDAFSAP
jgi:hypothetical protein